MFPRRQRLAREAFPTLLKSGQRLSAPHFSLSFAKEPRGYAVVIAKNLEKSAVRRHRLKRRVLALLTAQRLPPGLVVFARAGASALSSSEIKGELAAALAKIA